MKEMRLLKSDEIEVRVADSKNGRVHLLLYINSRAAGALLDETYGRENWNLEYHEVAGQPYGRLSIYDEATQRWVYREDTGEEAKISADKSLASDILKRLVVRFGVSELYSTPAIYVEDDGYGCNGYKVSEIEYTEGRKISRLVLVNRFGKEMYRWSAEQPQNSPKSAPKTVTVKDFAKTIEEMTLYCREYYKECQKEHSDYCPWITDFVNYYKAKLGKGDWNGEFRYKEQLKRWIERKVKEREALAYKDNEVTVF